MMLFTFALPIIQCCLASLTIGDKPTGLSVALVNEEMPHSLTHCLSKEWLGPFNCSEQDIPFSLYITQKLLNKSISLVSIKPL